MRARILNALRRADGPISGSRLASELDISRSAVWKHIQKLRSVGYEIAGSPRVGYRLLSTPDVILAEELSAQLPPVFRDQVVLAEQAGSTNDTAKGMAARGLLRPAGLVIAETQTAGRGRQGRYWSSPRGGIWMSMVVRPEIAVVQAQGMPLLVSVAMAEVLREREGVDARIKWPNDILIRGKKVAGILAELAAEWGKVEYLVVGLGLNANLRTADLNEQGLDATTLLEETGRVVDRTALAADIVTRIWGLLPRLGVDFSSILDRWRPVSATLGQPVTVTSAGQTVHGTAVDLDSQGGLIIDTDSGERRVFLVGEVTLRSRL